MEAEEKVTEKIDTDKHEWSEEILSRINEMCLFDDDFMSIVFDRNNEATEYVINTILERDDLKVERVFTQRYFANPMDHGRTIKIDIYAEDKDGKLYDIEIQGAGTDAKPQRARFHSAMMDTRMLRENQKFREMKDSYVIFITKTDVLRGGLPMYHVDRNIKELDRSFNDGSHIIYVNGAYKDKESEIGKLIHDFRCQKSSDIYSKVLKEQVSYFKDTEGGKEKMCKIIEEYGDIRAKESAEKNLLENIKTVMKKLNGSVDTAMDFLDVPKENWDKYRSMIL